jgi:hypothetical protein
LYTGTVYVSKLNAIHVSMDIKSKIIIYQKKKQKKTMHDVQPLRISIFKV